MRTLRSLLHKQSRQAGGALIVAMTMIVIIFGVVAALAITTSVDLNAVSAGDRVTHAGLYGLSGLHVALTEINCNMNLDTGATTVPAGIGNNYPVFNGNALTFTAFPATTLYAGGRPTGDTRKGFTIMDSESERVVTRLLDINTEAEITLGKPYPEAMILDIVALAGLSRGKFVGGYSTVRRYRAMLRRTIPFPSQADAAVAILGDPSKGKVDIKGKNTAGYVVGDGADQVDPATGVPGLGIEGRAIDVLKLKFQPESFVGYDGFGNPVNGAQSLSDPTLDFGAIDTAARAMDAYGQSLIAANTAVAITDGTRASPNSYTFGSNADSVTVISGAGSGSGKDYKGVNITGQGTLVIDGSVDFHDSNITWNGPIYVMGDDGGKNELKIDHSSTFIVNGDVFVLGVNDKKAKITVKGDNSGHNTNALIVNGALLAIADRSSKSKVDVNFKGDGGKGDNQGTIAINGYFGLFGDKVKLDAHHDKDAQFKLDGSLVLAVPDQDKTTKVDIKLSNQVDINYNSVLYNNAISSISQYLSKIDIPPAYTIGSFFEPALR